jgi:shikimate dehydrogenase
MLLTGKARLAGVVGWPVGHSLSPRLHGHWLERHGIDGAYVPLAVRPEHFEAAFRALPRLGFLGFNVTLPHKGAAFALADAHDPDALRMKAVNTVLVRPDGSTMGLNTDGFGFMANLRQQAPGWEPAAGPAVLIGSGGAARAVATALLDAGVPGLRLANRTAERAAALARDLRALFTAPIAAVPWPERAGALAGAGLCVNCSSLGMAGQPPLDLALDALPRPAPVVDIVYTPLRTGLLQAAAARGHATVDGLGMLLHQAIPGFAHWGGRTPVVDEPLRACLLEALAAR